MQVKVWGTFEDYKGLKKKYLELTEHICYTGQDRPIDPEVEKALARLKKDTEDMRYMKEKFVDIMDKVIKHLPDDEEYHFSKNNPESFI